MVSQQWEASTPAAANIADVRKPVSAIRILMGAGRARFSMMVLRVESCMWVALKAVVQMPDMTTVLQTV